MCGICGVFTPEEDVREASQAIPDLVRLMARRGPDDEGVWSDGAHLTFGFRRLSIIDPSPSGHQPMHFVDRYTIVFNGELYNYRDLRSELEAKGHRFATDSDTEVVLQALAAWDVEALVRFNGMFALAWYDRQRRRLLLARDPIGIKPLHYLVNDRGLLFGSQYDQLTRHPWGRAGQVQEEVLGLYLRLGHIPAPYGLLAGTHQLEAGHWLELMSGKPPRVRSYCEPLANPSNELKGSEAVEALDFAVENAVTRQLVSDVPVGSFLSGGVDSPLVAAKAAQESSSLPLFSIGFEDPEFDESKAASRYAKSLNGEHILRTFKPEDALGRLQEWSQAYTEPFADYSGFPTMLVAEMARDRGVKVLLSGDGGDELFWGYPRFTKVLDTAQMFRMPRLARVLAFAARRKTLPRGVMFPSVGEWYLDSHSGLKPTELRRLNPRAETLPTDFDLFESNGASSNEDVAQWLRKNEMGSHLQRILQKVDRASMWFGIEVRVPLLDLEVVACAEKIGYEECLGPDGGKDVLRKVMSRQFPRMQITPGKRGFGVPMQDWLRHQLSHLVDEFLLNRDPYPEGFFDHASIRDLVEASKRGAGRGGDKVWTLLALQLWADKHLQPLQY